MVPGGIHDVEALLDGALLEVVLELRDRGARQDAADDPRLLGRVDDVPGLHLAGAVGLVALRVVVRGMDLERELVVGREELDQEGVLPEAQGLLVAADLLALLLEEALEGPALEGAVGDDAGVLAALGDLPGLAALLARALLAHDLRQLRPAPDLVLVDLLEAKRVDRERALGHGGDSRGVP